MRSSRSAGGVASARAAGCGSLGSSCISLRAFEELPEAVETVVEHAAVVLHPRLDGVQPAGLQPAVADAPDLLGADEPCVLEHLDVLLDAGEADPGGRGELGDGRLAAAEALEDRAP